MSERPAGPTGTSVLQRLGREHKAAVLVFEQQNRSYFATMIGDRGEDYFAQFAERFADLVDAQAGGRAAFFVAVDAGGSVLGRFNLDHWADGSAELGYRVARRAAGQGMATRCVGELRRLAPRLGLRTIRAAVAEENPASQRVLAKNGFTPDGPATSSALGGRTGHWYRLDVATNG